MKGRFVGIVLAGGLSTRMRQFKPLLALGDTTVTDQVIATFMYNSIDVILVLGYLRDDIWAGIKKWDIVSVYNPDYERGMFSSIQKGMEHLPPTCQAFFLLPVDIPLIRSATIRRLIESADKNPENIIYPVFGGQRGHPPLIPAKLAPAILEWKENGGLKTFLGSQEKLALELPVADSQILFDIDTPEDYAALLERFRHYEIPSDEECTVILQDICKVDLDRIKHSLKVAELAFAIGSRLRDSGGAVDVELIRAAAVLHDIAKEQRRHDVAGGQILRDMGFGKVGEVVSVHSDLAGGNTHLPLDAKVVYLADKLVEGDRRVSLEDRYSSANRRLGLTPEIQAAVSSRLVVAQQVKQEIENLLGLKLESITT